MERGRRRITCRTFVVPSRHRRADGRARHRSRSRVAAADAVPPASIAAADAAVAWLVDPAAARRRLRGRRLPRLRDARRHARDRRGRPDRRTWSTAEALAAVDARRVRRRRAHAARRARRLAPTIPTRTDAGAAAKTIVLGAGPLGLDPSAFDPAGDGTPVDLVSLIGGCSATRRLDVQLHPLHRSSPSSLVCGAPAGDRARRPCATRSRPTAAGTSSATRRRHRPRPRHDRARGRGAGRRRLPTPPTRRCTPRSASSPPTSRRRRVAVVRRRRPELHRRSAILAITAAGFDVESPCWRDTADPATAGTAYASPTAWLRSQQLPARTGRIASPNDSFGVNTFATSQTVEGCCSRGCRSRVRPRRRARCPTRDRPSRPPVQPRGAGRR